MYRQSLIQPLLLVKPSHRIISSLVEVSTHRICWIRYISKELYHAEQYIFSNKCPYEIQFFDKYSPQDQLSLQLSPFEILVPTASPRGLNRGLTVSLITSFIFLTSRNYLYSMEYLLFLLNPTQLVRFDILQKVGEFGEKNVLDTAYLIQGVKVDVNRFGVSQVYAG